MNEQELIDKAAEFSIKMYPVSPYGKKLSYFGFATLTKEEMVEAVKLLAKAWFY
ncbi:hypothetical protein ABE288_09280 [Bacillus salipaludis]|uniref:hypothetical protein n=1 Tax=Bacillus salipaludis TaxID=2547811 RepID=UPI003D1DE87C